MTESIVVDLPENLTIATADSLHQRLDEYVLGHSDIVLNPAEVNRIDTAGLQLIYAFIISLKKQNLGCTWASKSDVITDAAIQLGLKEQLLL